MNLQSLADKAVVAFSQGRTKVSASQAVVDAVRGKGLNAKQIQRVCVKVNRALHNQEKRSHAPNMLWQSRFDTAKPEDVITAIGVEKVSRSLGDSDSGEDPVDERAMGSQGSPGGTMDTGTLDFQYRGLYRIWSDLDGDEVNVTDDSKTDESELSKRKGEKDGEDPDEDDEKPVKEASVVDPFSIEPTYRAVRPTLSDEERTAQALRAQWGHRSTKTSEVLEKTSHTRRVAAELDAKLEKIQAHVSELTEAVKVSNARVHSAEASMEMDRAVLVEEICSMERDHHFTLGEVLATVKVAFAHPHVRGTIDASVSEPWFVELADEAMQTAGVDPLAVAGRVRDDRGNLKQSEIAEARAHMVVRDRVREALRSPESINLASTLVKASAAYLHSYSEYDIARRAQEVLSQRLQKALPAARRVEEARDEILQQMESA